MNHFPEILIGKTKGIIEATSGIAMQSIIHGNLLLPPAEYRDSKIPQLNRMNPKNLHLGRESFLHALTGMPPELVLELHLIASPNLLAHSKSKFSVVLFLRTIGTSEEDAKEKIIKSYLSLKPIIAAHVTEADFSPITNKETLEILWQPFRARQVKSIEKRRQTFSLMSPLKKMSIGFGATAETKVEDTTVVEHVFPWRPSEEDWSQLLNTMMAQIDPVKIVIRLKVAHTDNTAEDRLITSIAVCDDFLASQAHEQQTLQYQANQIKKISLKQISRLSEGSFNLGVFLMTHESNCDSLVNVLGKAITGLHSRNDDESLWVGGFTAKTIEPKKVTHIDFFSDKESFSIPEAACAFRLPSPPIEEIPGLPVKRSRTSFALMLKDQETSDSVTLGVNNHQGISQVVKMSANDRMRHTFIVGQTGVGKSTLMEHLVIQDIQAGRGLAIIDPHGEMVDSLIGKIPPERAEDVILFDVLDRDRPFGFNLLEWKTIEERDLIIDELYASMHSLYDLKRTGGPIFESNFRGMLKLLMGDKPREDFTPTILEFVLCYLDSDFRESLQNNISDQQILDFVKELERTGGDCSLANLSPYITSKFSRFTQDITLKRIVGQEKTSFDFDKVMNEGKILLLKLGKGRFGSVVSSLLANQIVSRFKFSAMKRGEMPVEKRRDFFLYVDECHNLPAENFMELLAEARKYRMGLILATQYTAQLSGSFPGSDDNLLAAILGNVGTTITYRLGHDDAKKMSQALNPYFTAKDILGLPNWQGYIRLQVANQAVAPFSFENIKNSTPFNDDLAKKIKILSRLQYGTDKAIVDATINRRRSRLHN